MRLTVILALILALSACIGNPVANQYSLQNDLAGFKQFLGPEKSKADSLLVLAFLYLIS